MKKILSLLLISFLACFAFSGQVSNRNKIDLTSKSTSDKFLQTITGRILSQSGSDPLIGATVSLSKESNIIICQKQTDINGNFVLDSMPNSKSTLRISYIGYKPEIIAILGSTSGKLNLGDIFLSESTVKLDEITVNGSGIIEKVDKYIVLPSSDEVERAGRTINLLEQLNLPGLNVDRVLEKITVEDRTPIYQINGKEQPLNRILNLEAKDILRIEYSNNPGIRYLDRNASGIINFILKKPEEGGSIASNITAAFTTGFINGGVTGTFNYKKSQFALYYNTNFRDYDSWLANSVEKYISKKNNIYRTQQGINSPMAYFFNNINTEYTYMHDIHTMFSASVSNGINTQSGGNDGRITETINDTKSQYDIVTRRKGNSYNPSLDLFFSKKLRKGQSIELNAVGNVGESNYSRNLTYTYPNDTKLFQSDIKNNSWAVSGEAVYNKEFNKITTRFGLQYTHNYAKNKYIETDTPSELQKDNTYAYGEMKGKIKKLSYSLGTGVKFFSVDNYSESKTYIRNLSTVSLLLPLPKRWSLSYVLMYRPTLPSLSSLSPISQTVNDLELQAGNPALRPSENIYNRLLLRFNNGKGFTLAAWAKYSHTFNPITSIYTYNDETDKFISSPVNGKYENVLSFQLNLGYQRIFNHLNIFWEGQWNKYNTSGELYKHTYSNFSNSITAQAYWGNWVTGASYTITPQRSLSGETIRLSEEIANIYIQYKYKNLYITGFISNLFKPDGYKYESQNLSTVAPSTWVNWTKNNGNMFMLSINYTTSFGHKYKKGKKTLENGGYDNGMNKVN